MARKLISFLGVGGYDTVNYYFETENKRLDYSTPFIQLALTHFFQPDEAVILLTSQAESMNWLGNKEQRGDKLYPDMGLKEAAARYFPQTRFTPLSIPAGQGENEIWDIFEIVNSVLEPKDSIIFDITHSFRSIPVIGLACLQYARSLKGIGIEGIYYGNWEARDSGEKYPSAPVEDVTPFLTLMDWSHAVQVFQRHGQVEALTDLLEEEVLPRKKASRGRDKEAKLLDGLRLLLKKSHSNISTCRGGEIYQSNAWQTAQAIIEDLAQTPNTVSAFYPLLDMIQSKLEQLKGPEGNLSPEARKGLGAVQWCLEHGLVQQAYTLLQESLITLFCQKSGLDYHGKKDRELAAQGLSWTVQKRPEEEWKGEASKRPEKIKEIQAMADEQIFRVYDRITQNRNNINHAGTVDCFKADKLAKDIHNFFNDLLNYFQK